MRTRSRLVRIAIVAMAVGSGAVAGCTALPQVTPSSATSTGTPTLTPVPGNTLPLAPVIELAARNIEFDRQAIDVHAGVPFVIHFRNLEVAGVAHNVDIRRSDGVNAIREQQLIDGGAEVDYEFPALAVGNYIFICRVHPIPGMTGTLLVR